MMRLVILATCLAALCVFADACKPKGDHGPNGMAQHDAPPPRVHTAAGDLPRDEAEAVRAQDAVESASGADVLAAVARGAVPMPAAGAADVATGSGEYALATLGKLAPPPAAWDAGKIVADPPGYRKAAEKAHRVANGTQLAFAVKAALWAAIPVALGILRVFAPGPWSVGLDAVWSFAQTKVAKKEDEAAHDLLGHVSGAFAQYDALPDGERAAFAALAARLPPKVAQVVGAARQAVEPPRGPLIAPPAAPDPVKAAA